MNRFGLAGKHIDQLRLNTGVRCLNETKVVPLALMQTNR